MPSNVTNFNIRDVWKNNMEEEFAKIRDVVEKYPYVAMVSFTSYYLSRDFLGANVKSGYCIYMYSNWVGKISAQL